jgi:hypothetical protein
MDGRVPSNIGVLRVLSVDILERDDMCKVNYVTANVLAMAGLLTGATIVHNLYKPDLVRAVFHFACFPWQADASSALHVVLCGAALSHLLVGSSGRDVFERLQALHAVWSSW